MNFSNVNKFIGSLFIISFVFINQATAFDINTMTSEKGFMSIETNKNTDDYMKNLVLKLLKNNLNDYPEIIENLIKDINDGGIQITSEIDEKKQYVFRVKTVIKEKTFNDLIKETENINSETLSESNNITIYNVENMFFALKNEIFMASNDKNALIDMVKAKYPSKTLYHNAYFQKYYAKVPKEYIIKGFLKPNEFSYHFIQDNSNEEISILDNINYIAFWIQKITNGYKMTFMTDVKSELLKYYSTFSPAIKNAINSENIILFHEGNNLLKSMELIKDYDHASETFFETIEMDLQNTIGLSLQKEILPLAQNEYAIIVKSDLKNIIPEITFALKSDDITLSEKVGGKIIDYLDKNTKETFNARNKSQETKRLLEENIKKEKNGYLWSIKFGKEITEKEINFFPTESIQIHSGYYNGYFIISNAESIQELFNKKTDAMFEENFSILPNAITGIYHINIENLKKHIILIAKELNSDEETIKNINTLLNPFKHISSVESIEEGTIKQTITFGISFDDLNLLIKESKNIFPKRVAPKLDDSMMYGKEIKFITNTEETKTEFSDAPSSAWYYEHIRYVSENKIMKGYADKTFKPDQPISRAEFVKTIHNAYEKNSNIANSIERNVFNLKDVEKDWYFDSVKIFYENEIINGYPDKTFKPHQPISRAEAVSIITKTISLKVNKEKIELPFTDVKPDDWFYDNVLSLYKEKIISGKNRYTFDPHGNLTRAEAAKIITLLKNK